ncbi:MAG: phenylpyruvate tautomerase MIF-related protein [Acutalibacteraceae bacterium]
MPYINSKISTKITKEQETQLKTQLGQAIAIIPGKSERWLMVGFQDEFPLYFGGDNSAPSAFIEVSVLGEEDGNAFSELTARLCEIYNSVLGISPDRIYIKYEGVTYWGWNGGNF